MCFWAVFWWELFPPGGAVRKCIEHCHEVHRSGVSSSDPAVALAGQDDVQSIAFTLTSIDMNFFFFFPFISHRKERLVTGEKRLTIS